MFLPAVNKFGDEQLLLIRDLRIDAWAACAAKRGRRAIVLPHLKRCSDDVVILNFYDLKGLRQASKARHANGAAD